jgi:GxxExxY protein
MHPNEITSAAISTAIDIHRKLGPGLLESVYRVILAHELRKRGFHVEVEVWISIIWEGFTIPNAFRADILIDDAVFIEVKSLEKTAAVHQKQLLTYLRLTDKRVGLLINFGSELLKDGIVRVVNRLEE